ncbi:MAG TPA: mechanosensitive ion channel domain-containing protein, partial [Candidatus Binataceae bacterium]
MEPTPLQTVLSLHAIARDWQVFVEVLIAVVAVLFAIALRRRKWLFSTATFAMLAAGFIADLAATFANKSDLYGIVGAIAVVFFFWALIRFLMEAAEALFRRGREHFSTIFKDLLTALSYALVVMLVLRFDFGVNPFSLAITFGAASVVIGLALQATLGDIFSGLALQLQKPFDPGDWVKSGDHVGRVQGVGLRSTTIITRANERLEIPNSAVAKDVLINYAGAAIGDEISVGISYDVPPGRVRETVARVVRDLPHVLSTPAPEVYAWEYGDYAIKYRIKYWLADYGVEERVRDSLVSSLWYALRRHGIEIPYPVRSVEVREARRGRGATQEYEREVMSELRQVPFLQHLADDELRVLVPSVQVHQFGAGEVLLRQGEPGDSLYMIRRGTVEV